MERSPSRGENTAPLCFALAAVNQTENILKYREILGNTCKDRERFIHV